MNVRVAVIAAIFGVAAACTSSGANDEGKGKPVSSTGGPSRSVGITGGQSAKSICFRHFPHATVAVNTTVADARFIGGPRPTTPIPGPLDTFPAADRVVRCLVPLAKPSGAVDADVYDIVEPADRPFLRWQQGGSTTEIISVG
jgi:hypothetical protein